MGLTLFSMNAAALKSSIYLQLDGQYTCVLCRSSWYKNRSLNTDSDDTDLAAHSSFRKLRQARTLILQMAS